MPRRLLGLAPWLAEGKHVWITIAVLALGVGICIRTGASEPLIRLTGLGLQVLGVATAVWGIVEIRKFFGRPSPLALFLAWLERCPLRGSKIIAGVGTAVSRSFAGKLRGYSSVPMDPSAEPEVRIGALEKNVGFIQERITAIAREIDGDVSALRDQLEREAEQRERLGSQVHTHIEGVATGGLHITAMGAAWLFVGVVLSTAAPELSSLLR